MTHTFFFNGPYDETMALLIEARNYIAYHDAAEHRKLPPQVRLQISYESMRVTSRLTQVMAWLLAQKAVHAGEMTKAQADKLRASKSKKKTTTKKPTTKKYTSSKKKK